MQIKAFFWVLPATSTAEVLAAANLKSNGHDQFIDVLHSKSTFAAGAEFWSYALLPCLQYLHDKKSVDLLKFMETEFADSIYDARRTICVEVPFNDARRIGAVISDFRLDETDMRNFYNDLNDEDNKDAGHAMIAAFEATKVWLAQVRADHIGLMTIK